MKKLLSILKWIVFGVGATTILLIAWAGGMALLDRFKGSSNSADDESYIFYKTSFERHKLVVQSVKEDDYTPKMIITGPDGKTSSLPLSEFSGTVSGCTITPFGGGKYGIAILREAAEDVPAHYIDLVTYDKSLRHVKTITMGSGVYLDGKNRKVFATMYPGFPYVEDLPQLNFAIPAVIEIESEVTITPLITAEGANLIRGTVEKNRKKFLEKLRGPDMEEDLKRYLDAEKETKELLTTQRINFMK